MGSTCCTTISAAATTIRHPHGRDPVCAVQAESLQAVSESRPTRSSPSYEYHSGYALTGGIRSTTIDAQGRGDKTPRETPLMPILPSPSPDSKGWSPSHPVHPQNVIGEGVSFHPFAIVAGEGHAYSSPLRKQNLPHTRQIARRRLHNKDLPSGDTHA